MIIRVAALLVSFLSVFPSFGQNPSPLGSRVEIEFGSVNLWLGMPQAEAVARMRQRKFVIGEIEDKKLTAVMDSDQIYFLAFDSGKLSFASRRWSGNGKQPQLAIVEALSVLSQWGDSCRLYHDEAMQPSLITDRIMIQCGSRSVLIIASRDGKAVEVDERIGWYNGD